MKIGYARVSTGLQNLNLQEDRLNAYGCEKIFNDHMSGSKSKRPGLDKAIEFARSGDTIVVWRLDRLGRNMEDLITLVNELNERGVSFHSLEENITMDKSSSTGQLLFHLLFINCLNGRHYLVEAGFHKYEEKFLGSLIWTKCQRFYQKF